MLHVLGCIFTTTFPTETTVYACVDVKMLVRDDNIETLACITQGVFYTCYRRQIREGALRQCVRAARELQPKRQTQPHTYAHTQPMRMTTITIETLSVLSPCEDKKILKRSFHFWSRHADRNTAPLDPEVGAITALSLNTHRQSQVHAVSRVSR